MTSASSPDVGAQPGARALAAPAQLVPSRRRPEAARAGRRKRPNEPEKLRRNRALTFVGFPISLRFALLRRAPRLVGPAIGGAI